MKRKTWIAWLMMAVVLVAGVIAVFALSRVQQSSETELVRDAVKNAALSCYAVEGAFPSSIEYLKEHYGLVYDEEQYIIAYDAFAVNVLPDITVMEKGVTDR